VKLLDIFTFLRVDIINCYLDNIWHVVDNVGNYVTWCLKEKGRKTNEKDCLSTATSLESETENPLIYVSLFQLTLNVSIIELKTLQLLDIYMHNISHDDIHTLLASFVQQAHQEYYWTFGRFGEGAF
jgi:hypothetical protein